MVIYRAISLPYYRSKVGMSIRIYILLLLYNIYLFNNYIYCTVTKVNIYAQLIEGELTRWRRHVNEGLHKPIVSIVSVSSSSGVMTNGLQILMLTHMKSLYPLDWIILCAYKMLSFSDVISILTEPKDRNRYFNRRR